ncbi:MAG: hypothetical protein JXX14_09975 [Deltaproteobacteria bacterium]|nr:hypothetical protein [Deltaproteobacteria bacterium]
MGKPTIFINTACSQLENCVNDSWDDPDNRESIQKFCFDNAGPAVTKREFQAFPDKLGNYGDAALKLDEKADLVSAKCWVGLFAEAIRNPTLFKQMRRLIDTEVSTIQRLSGGTISNKEASALLAYVIGSLIPGAFAPQKTAGFALTGFRKLLSGFRQ